MASGGCKRRTGKITGTGAVINIQTLDFRPTGVNLYNVTGNAQAHWQDTMADASMQKTVDSGTDTTNVSFVTSNGITPLANGFRIGTDGDLNVDGEVIHWEAFD